MSGNMEKVILQREKQNFNMNIKKMFFAILLIMSCLSWTT